MKQNQQLFRPFPGQNPEIKDHDQLYLQSKCQCPPCKMCPQKIKPQICFDQDINSLRNKKSEISKQSAFVSFLNEIQSHSDRIVPNFQMLDTIVFNSDGTIRYIICYENNKLKFTKLTSLKSFIFEKKHLSDLQYQKKKYQRDHLNFSFTQLDHQSQKLIKQFETNIKFTNPLHNRMVISKQRKKQQQVLTQTEMNSIFAKLSRKIFDFSSTEYLQIFPIMYGEQQNSYKKHVKYFRNRQCRTPIFRAAEHYVSNWINKNETMQKLEEQYISSLKDNEDSLLMYYTCKIFIFFQLVSNKMVQSALLCYITNDNGASFALKNIETLQYFKLHEIEERSRQLKTKLDNNDTINQENQVQLRGGMKKLFNNFQINYNRLKSEKNSMEDKLQKDIEFSNQVYESLGYQSLEKGSKQSFITSVFHNPRSNEKGKIQFGAREQTKQML